MIQWREILPRLRHTEPIMRSYADALIQHRQQELERIRTSKMDLLTCFGLDPFDSRLICLICPVMLSTEHTLQAPSFGDPCWRLEAHYLSSHGRSEHTAFYARGA